MESKFCIIARGYRIMKIKVIVAHPDDEIIGVGGTIAKHVDSGDEVSVLILAEGKSSRFNSYDEFCKDILEEYINETEQALAALGVSKFKLFSLPNNRFDGMELIDIVKIIENEINLYKPDVVYTHYYGDMNVDHQQTSKAVTIACRALPGCSVHEILMFETLSSTESSLGIGIGFTPNYFVEISKQVEKKLNAMSCYKSELREEPHPRSISSIKRNSELWGSKVGVDSAEAFVVSRIVR
jgi:LmbE family N-acetylglucosaminyl deacetylase